MSIWQQMLGMPADDQQQQSPAATTQPQADPSAEEDDQPDPNTTEGMHTNLQNYMGGTQHLQDDYQKKIKDYQKMLSSENGPFDATGTLNIIDNLYGTHYAAANKAPLTPAQQAEKVAKMQDEGIKQRQPTTQDLIREYASKMQNESAMSKLQSAQARYLSSQTDKEGKGDKKDIMTAYEHTMNDKNVLKAKGELDSYNNALSTVDDAATNPTSANAVGVALARYATGGQRINRQELEALGQGSKDWSDRVKQIYTTAIGGGVLTPENVEYARKFLAATHGSAQSNFATNAKGRSDAYSKMLSIPKEQLYDLVGLDGKGGYPSSEPPSGQPAQASAGQAKGNVNAGKLSAYATQHNIQPAQAAKFLKGKGYVVEGY